MIVHSADACLTQLSRFSAKPNRPTDSRRAASQRRQCCKGHGRRPVCSQLPCEKEWKKWKVYCRCHQNLTSLDANKEYNQKAKCDFWSLYVQWECGTFSAKCKHSWWQWLLHYWCDNSLQLNCPWTIRVGQKKCAPDYHGLIIRAAGKLQKIKNKKSAVFSVRL